ncbi:multicomponent Na+:H+ antiporter subunit A [Geodermatophilus dictyosporus]|uniref:Multicomponent Na+:H+ antiporter subunit A n=1 Tax=Geodermatophilus dictyosporus TaxID=1523247 RepID=A0A1I5JUF9_9ACTN|nr:hydrogen gas-evolving membrane-bound hydrogenase subunit E [Geodermatophilus dictyosporus]SFO76143.1 multicomponent Na+:H+ antiporter subunit A [Geodermatophilus dictyosporus]
MPAVALVVMAVLAAAAPLLHRRLGRNTGYVLAAGFAVTGALLATGAPTVLDGGAVTASWSWLPSLQVSFALRLDGLAALFCLIVLGVGTLIMAYCPRYVGDGGRTGTVYGLLTAFAGAMLGLVLAADLVLLYVFWELTTVCSFFLLATAGRVAVAPARRALLITAAGGLALLVAVVALSVVVGSTDLSTVLAARDEVLASPLAWPIGALIAFAAFTKSAQVPLHSWLPGAMVAMTPVSAYLHAATMVKAGIYLLMRTTPLFAGQPAWSALLVTVGLASAVTGAFLALREHDLKAILAQSTVSQLGLLVAVIGVGTPTALAAAMLHTFAHALFKATLFMLVGVVDKETGSRDIRELSGLRRVMPVTATVTALAALSMAGVPPMLGFVSKEYLFQSLVQADVAPWAGPVAGALAVAASALTFAYGVRIVHGAFGGPVRQPDLYEPSPAFLAPAVVAASAGLLLGPGIAWVRPVVTRAAADVVPAGEVPQFEFWHGLSPEVVMSAITIAVGTALFLRRDPVDRALQRLRLPDGAAVFDRAHDAVLDLGSAVGRPDRSRDLAPHLARPLVALGVLGAVGVAAVGGLPERGPTDRALDWPVLALLVLTVAGTVLARSALAALGLVGVVGLVVAVWFLLAGAVDVALTLLLVEVLTAVVAVLVLRSRPPRLPGSDRPRTVLAAGLAVAAGTGAAAAVYALTGRRGISGAGAWFLDNAEPQTGGTNVVNTVLVDFRGMDTLGEAIVLGAAALGLLVVVARRAPEAAPDRAARGRPDGTGGGLVLQVAARVLVPGMAALSLWLLWRGHDEPGGGFISALVAGTAVGLHQTAHAFPGLPRLLRPTSLVGGGLLLALGTGLFAVVRGEPLLTPVEVPLLGALGIGSALLFDLGVYLLVLALLVTAFDRLGGGPVPAVPGPSSGDHREVAATPDVPSRQGAP